MASAPSGEASPGCGGTTTLALPSLATRRAAGSGSAPPKATSESPEDRGSARQDAADGAGSGGVDDLDDARRGLQRVQPERLADPEPDRLLRSLRVEPQPSPEEVVGIQVPGHQIGVRDRRLRPPRP